MAQQMIERLKMRQSFNGMATELEDCLTISSSVIAYIADDDTMGVSHFVDNSGEHDKCLKVINLQSHEYALLGIDHSLIKEKEGGIADCGVFDDRKFWMVEFKTNAQGNSDVAVEDTYKKAINQIEKTIELFSDSMSKADVDFVEASDLQCNIVTARSFPRMTALEASLSLEFAMDNNGVPLYFSRAIEF